MKKKYLFPESKIILYSAYEVLCSSFYNPNSTNEDFSDQISLDGTWE